jgi:hypothetical protein
MVELVEKYAGKEEIEKRPIPAIDRFEEKDIFRWYYFTVKSNARKKQFL